MIIVSLFVFHFGQKKVRRRSSGQTAVIEGVYEYSCIPQPNLLQAKKAKFLKIFFKTGTISRFHE